jgi:hypothetical protein
MSTIDMTYPPKKADAWAVWVFVAGLLVLIGVAVYIATLHLATGIALTAFWVSVLCLMGAGMHYENDSRACDCAGRTTARVAGAAGRDRGSGAGVEHLGDRAFLLLLGGTWALT